MVHVQGDLVLDGLSHHDCLCYRTPEDRSIYRRLWRTLSLGISVNLHPKLLHPSSEYREENSLTLQGDTIKLKLADIS